MQSVVVGIYPGFQASFYHKTAGVKGGLHKINEKTMHRRVAANLNIALYRENVFQMLHTFLVVVSVTSKKRTTVVKRNTDELGDDVICLTFCLRKKHEKLLPTHPLSPGHSRHRQKLLLSDPYGSRLRLARSSLVVVHKKSSPVFRRQSTVIHFSNMAWRSRLTASLHELRVVYCARSASSAGTRYAMLLLWGGLFYCDHGRWSMEGNPTTKN
jgi:hypothetical protein